MLETITSEKIFKGTSTVDLLRTLVQTRSWTGYCYHPETKSELNRRMKERINETRRLQEIYSNLSYSTKEINMNFRIKVSGTRDGVKYNKLVGVSGLVEILGKELFNKFVNRAFNSADDKIVCKLRTGLKVTFYSK